MVTMKTASGEGKPFLKYERSYKMNINFELKAELLDRGFVVTNENNIRMSFANGSIANYKKCTIVLGHRVYGDIANEHFYLIHYEAFTESGHPEIDCHIITESYIAESEILEFLKSKGILSRAERAERMSQFRARRIR